MEEMFKLFMTASAIEAASVVFSEVHTLMESYKAKGIDVIPVSELEAVYSKAALTSTQENSMTNKVMKSYAEGELKCQNMG